MKTEFEEQKQVELEDLRRSFSSEQEEKERSYTGKMSQLTAQLQQLDAVVAQVLHTHTCTHIKNYLFWCFYRIYIVIFIILNKATPVASLCLGL